MPTITSGAVPRQRVHITNPRDWGMSAGTDYWASFGDLTLAPAAAQDLVKYGWLEAGTWAQLAGSAAGLIDSSDVGTTGGANFPAADDSIVSPFIFGDQSHALLAGAFLGYTPTTLNMECYARFAAANDEESSGFGFVEAGATTTFIKGDLMAIVAIDGTDFSLESGVAAAAGSTKNTTAHRFRIEAKSGSAINWYIDDTLQANTLAVQANLWPVAFCITTATGGNNDPVVAWVHVWYS